MKTTMTSTMAFVMAAVWLAIALWAAFTSSTLVFIVGGAILAVAFVVVGVAIRRASRDVRN